MLEFHRRYPDLSYFYNSYGITCLHVCMYKSILYILFRTQITRNCKRKIVDNDQETSAGLFKIESGTHAV